MSLDPQSQTVPFTCPTHGDMQVTVFKIFRDWSTPVCPICKEEQKQVRERQERAEEERRREHQRRRMIEDRIKRACIPLRFQGKRFEDYHATTPAAGKNLAICRDYADRFPEHARRGTSMILCGHTGTGKTHLACAIGNHIIHHHEKSAVYMQVSEAIRMVKETYVKGASRTEQQAIDWFKAADLLILDEVGVQFGTDAERYILFEIINGRYEEMKPTLLISNLAVNGMIENTGARSIDRMKENGGMMLVFDWQSNRGAQNLTPPAPARHA